MNNRYPADYEMVVSKRFFISILILLYSISNIQAQKVYSGESHNYVICSDSILYAWGRNVAGELGDGTNTNRTSPIQSLIPGDSIYQISTTGYSTLILRSDSSVLTCGQNYYGQLGDGTTIDQNIPVSLAFNTKIVKVSSGGEHSFFLDSNGDLWCGGRNDKGQLGIGNNMDQLIPVKLTGFSGVKDITCAGRSTFFIKSNGTVWACGYNIYGQLGDGTYTDKNTPVQLTTLSNIVEVSSSGTHSLFLRNDSTVWAVGQNGRGQRGDSVVTTINTPIKIQGLPKITSMSSHGEFPLFLDKNSQVWGCGDNLDGQLGLGGVNKQITPTQLPQFNNVKKICTGYKHSLVVKNDNSIWLTGSNQFGQLGDGTFIGKTTPYKFNMGCCFTSPLQTQTPDICQDDSIQVGSNYYSSSGVYHDTLTSSQGCDSIVRTILNVNPTYDQVWNVNINSGDSVIVGSSVYKTPRTYIDSLLSIDGCDSVITTNLGHIGIDEYNLSRQLKVYPNPANLFFQLESDEELIDAEISMIDAVGKRVLILNHLTGDKVLINCSALTQGVYFLHLRDETRSGIKRIVISH